MTNLTNTQPPFEEILGVQFHNLDLLTQALTHRSFVNEYDGEEEIRDNERLEFLGDAILDVVVADMLFRKFPDVSEGELTQLRAALVKTESLAFLATQFNLASIYVLVVVKKTAVVENVPTICAVDLKQL